ncbi:amidase [Oceanicola sp. 22II-s10i]|uniref:DUF4169 family protein n=1 Tax=Oceanicola sp. 22II-s10i TaxID=1317116 RepID=UPI000B527BBE|nr:DUF4169 family protein [Oceanicola sp. 22II-s10i]OWU83637.1 amidase [Oceanicola sp. 22II-s10i]
MADKPISLNQVRKAKARADRKTQADANAVKFGRTKAEKAADRLSTDKARRDLDGHKRDE